MATSQPARGDPGAAARPRIHGQGLRDHPVCATMRTRLSDLGAPGGRAAADDDDDEGEADRPASPAPPPPPFWDAHAISPAAEELSWLGAGGREMPPGLEDDGSDEGKEVEGSEWEWEEWEEWEGRLELPGAGAAPGDEAWCLVGPDDYAAMGPAPPARPRISPGALAVGLLRRLSGATCGRLGGLLMGPAAA